MALLFLFLQDVYCKYSMYLEEDIKTEVIAGTRNPEFNYERRFTFEQCTPKVMKLLICNPLRVTGSLRITPG